jgi:hypothetical protein
MNSYAQLAGGKQPFTASNSVSLDADHPPVAATNFVAGNHGWNFEIISSDATNDAVHHYFFNTANGMATATLVWNRQMSQTNINDLDLFLYDAATSNLVACSTSRVDNVEHIFLPQLPAGSYDLQVLKHGGTNVVSDAESYALAFEFVSPSLNITVASQPILNWPVYPSGFVVEWSTNLFDGGWTTNGISSSVITNGSYVVSLDATNATQFFRLRRP